MQECLFSCILGPVDVRGSAALPRVKSPARLTTVQRRWPCGSSAWIQLAPSCGGFCAVNEGCDSERERAVISQSLGW